MINLNKEIEKLQIERQKNFEEFLKFFTIKHGYGDPDPNSDSIGGDTITPLISFHDGYYMFDQDHIVWDVLNHNDIEPGEPFRHIDFLVEIYEMTGDISKKINYPTFVKLGGYANKNEILRIMFDKEPTKESVN